MESSDSKPRTSRRQFRIRSLFLAVLLAAIACAWYTSTLRHYHQEQRTISELEEFNLGFGLGSVAPTWIPRVKAFERINEVTSPPEGAPGKPFTDAGLRKLCALRHVEQLCLEKTRVTDEGLRHLRKLRRLKRLDLSQTPITDAGLNELLPLNTLEELVLDYTGQAFGGRTSDRGIARLAALPNLRTLSLFGTSAADSTARALVASPKLRFVDLRETEVSHEALETLREARADLTVLSD